MGISNCIKCNKVFQRDQSPLCPNCLDATKDQAMHVVDFVVAYSGLTVEEVAQQCGLPLKDLEEMLFSGRLGSAAAHIMFKCQSCHKKMSARLRKGRFCPDCAGKIEAKVSQMEREAVQKEKEATATAKPRKRPSDTRDDHHRPAAETDAAMADCKPAAPEAAQPVHPEIAPKQESVSPASDSYGFKRVSDM